MKPNGKQAKVRERIHICVPAIDNSVTLHIQSFLNACTIANFNDNCPWSFTWDAVNDKKPVEYARNVLVQRALEQPTVSRVWFIDQDMGAPPNVMEMLQVDADIVCAQAYNFVHANDEIKAPRMKMCAFVYGERSHAFTPISAVLKAGDSIVQEVDACGAATMLVRRRVLEDPLLHLDPNYVDLDGETHSLLDELGAEPPALFRTLYKPNGAVLRSEDIDFTWRARMLGYKIAVHLGVKFSHYKKVDLGQVVEFTHRVAEEFASDPQFWQIRQRKKEAVDAEVRQMEDQAKGQAQPEAVRVDHPGGGLTGEHVDREGLLRGDQESLRIDEAAR